MRIRNFARLTMAAVGLVTGVMPAMAAWPERAVTIIVPAGAGGGTDATARLLADALQQRFGQPFNIVNQGEGGGYVGIANMAAAVPDGYTLGILFNYAQYSLMGIGEASHTQFTPLGQYNFDPATVTVSFDAPYQSVKEVLNAIKADPSKYNIACGGSCGSSWDSAFAALLLKDGIDVSQVHFIPSQGAAAGLQELAAGSVDFISVSLPESRALAEAKKVRVLGVFGSERVAAFPDIPTVVEQTDLLVNGGAWRGVVGPAGLPDDISNALSQAIKEIYDSESFQTQMKQRGFGLLYRDGPAMLEFMKEHEATMASVLTALGVAK
jgi:tripartite-type tricarboxylate transporter receptor subunit TctC